MPETITVSRVIPARAERIYTAWLDAGEHSKMTGQAATSGPDGQFTAGDGYMEGTTTESTPFSRIVQRWRSKDFPEGAPDSTLTVTFEEKGEGTLVTLVHAGVPDGLGQSFKDGWGQWYFDPMTTYFTSVGSKLKDVGEALEGAVEKTGEAVGQAMEEAGEQLQATAKEVKKTVAKAGKGVKKAVSTARKQAARAGKEVKKAVARAGKAAKKVEKKATARAGALRKRLQKVLKRKPAKKAAPKKAAARKPAPKKKSRR